MLLIVPVVAVENGVKADSLDRRTPQAGLLHLLRDLEDPLPASYANVTGLGNK
jgi:hypothetical protein